MAVRFRIVFATVGCAALPWGSTAADLRSCGLPDGDACKAGDQSLLQVTSQAHRASRAKSAEVCCFQYKDCFDIGGLGDGIRNKYGHVESSGEKNVACRRWRGVNGRDGTCSDVWWAGKADNTDDDWGIYFGKEPEYTDFDGCVRNELIGQWFSFEEADQSQGFGKPIRAPTVKKPISTEDRAIMKLARHGGAATVIFDCQRGGSCGPDGMEHATGNRYLPWVKIEHFPDAYVYNYRIHFECTEPLSVCFIDECNDYYYKQCSTGDKPNVDYNSDEPSIKKIYVYLESTGDMGKSCSDLGLKRTC